MARKPKAEDLLDLAFVSDPQLSPDGRRAACVVTRIVPGSLRSGGQGTGNVEGGAKYEAPRYRSRVHLFQLSTAVAPDAKASTSRRLAKASRPSEGQVFTNSEFTDSAPRFSPDGSLLAFLSVRSEGAKPQLHVIPLAGGEAIKITDLKAGVGEFTWHPDSRRLAFVSRGDYQNIDSERRLPRRIAQRYFRADGQGDRPEVPAQVYLVSTDGGDPRKLTDLEFSPRSPAFAPNGDKLYLLAASSEDADSNSRSDLLCVDVASGVATALVTELTSAANVQVSPSGRRLSYSAPAVSADLASPDGVWLLDLNGPKRARTQPRLISDPDVDATPSLGGDSRYGSMPNAPQWLLADDGTESLVINPFVGSRSGLARLSVDGESSRLTSDHDAVTSFAVASGQERLLFTAEAADRPGELFVRYEDGREVRLSGVNDAWCSRLVLAPAQGPFSLKPASKRGRQRADKDVAGRERVQYWTMAAPKPRRDGAAVIEVHGGPHTAFGNGFYFEFQLLAGRGYSVIFGNPRGGSSYGHAFATSLLGRYGSVDADDVMDIGDEGLARLGDTKAPLHVTGGSYGGFMTNWLVGQTNRFRSAVTQRSISNWISMYGTSDIGPRFVEREIGGIPWTDLDRLWQQSPIKYVANIATPLLIVHSENDFRCPIEQGEQLFTALKRLGKVDVELFRVPDEGHELSRSGRPDRRIARLEAIVGWFESHP